MGTIIAAFLLPKTINDSKKIRSGENRSMKPIEVSKYSFYTVSILTVLGLFFGLGLYAGYHRTIVFKKAHALMNGVERSLMLSTEEASTLTKTRPKHYLQHARYGGGGITLNEVNSSEKELVLIAGFFNEDNGIRLIQRNGGIVNQWTVRFSEIFADAGRFQHPPATDWNVDIHGTIALQDGSVLFNFENYGLVKLTKNGDVSWTLSNLNHHSIECAEGGGFWVPGRRYVSAKSISPYPPFKPPFYEDYVMKISEDGDIVSEISVAELFYKNNLEYLLTLSGGASPSPYRAYHYSQSDRELFHLNDIEELYSGIADSFPLFEAGDLAISLRNRNLVIVFSPDTMKVKWWKIGPWIRQHDVDFQNDGTITVFNNNRDSTPTGSALGHSNIMKMNPVTGDYQIIYGAEPGQVMHTNIRGKHQVLPGNRLLITEHEGGRVFETDKNGRILWEFINRYDSDEIAEITEARIYPYRYFSETN